MRLIIYVLMILIAYQLFLIMVQLFVKYATLHNTILLIQMEFVFVNLDMNIKMILVNKSAEMEY